MEILKTFGQEKSFPHVKCLWDIWRRTSEQNHICVFVGAELFPDNQLVSVSLLFLCVCFLCMFLCERAPSASKNGCVEITLYKGLEGFRWPVTSCIVCRTLRLKMRQQVGILGDFSAAAHFISLSLAFLVISVCETPVETNQILQNEAVRWC